MYRFKIHSVFFIIAGILLALMLGGCGYNRLQEMEEDVFKVWVDLEAGLQKRTDLISDLVAVVKRNTGHDKKAIARLVNARHWAAAAVIISVEELENREVMTNLQKSQNAQAAALSHLLGTLEGDLALEGNPDWLALKDRIGAAEDRVQTAGQRYNQKVDLFNAAIRKFPDALTNKFFLELEPKLHYETHAQRQP